MSSVGVAGQFLAIAEAHVGQHLPPGIDPAYLQGFVLRHREALLDVISDLIERTLETEDLETEDRCLYCETGFDEFGDCGVDVLINHTKGDVWVQWISCCDAVRDEVGVYGFEAVYGVSLQTVVKRICGYEVLGITEPGDSAVVGRLGVINPTQPGDADAKGHRAASSPAGWQTQVFDAVNRHHRHHEAPAGHKFSLAVHNGPVRVGVAVVGRPVSRLLGAAHTLEVTRLATWGHDALRRNAASKLYAAAARQAAILGYARIITYTLAEEEGGSLRAAGWTPTNVGRGGSWNRKSRPREDKAPTGPKVRWEFGLNAVVRRDVEARRLTELNRPRGMK